MKDTVETRALKIAAAIMQADGLCRYERASQCRRLYVTEKACETCIRQWLITKAKKELRQEALCKLGK